MSNARRGARPRSAACLVALTFFSVTGGPFGQELIVRAGGPLLALSGLVVFTLLWSVPEAIMTAELSAAYPEAAGFAAWTNAAFGPFLAWIDSWCSWSSGVIDNAVYPILFLAYLEALTGGGPWSPASRGAFVVGSSARSRGCSGAGSASRPTRRSPSALVLAPFAVMCALAAAGALAGGSARGAALERVPEQHLLERQLLRLASAWSAEVDRACWGRAMAYAVALCLVSSLLPMLAATGASADGWQEYREGHYVDVARQIGGHWLAIWVVVAAAAANVGLFVAEMSSDAYQAMGMARRGLVPAALARRSRFRTPTVSIRSRRSACSPSRAHVRRDHRRQPCCTSSPRPSSAPSTSPATAPTPPRAGGGARAGDAAPTARGASGDEPEAEGLDRRPRRQETVRVAVGERTIAVWLTLAGLLLMLVAAVQTVTTWVLAFGVTLVGIAMYFFIGPTRRRGWCQYRRLSAKWAPRAPGDIGWTCGWRDRLLDGAAASAEQSESDDSDDEREDRARAQVRVI